MPYSIRYNQNENWQGIDVCHEISLFEYKLLIKPRTEDYPDGYFVIYQIGETSYSTAFIRESDLNNLVNGKEWASKEDINHFLSFVGMKTSEWMELSVIHKLSDLISYWGSENILGTDYYSISLKDVLRLYNK